MSDRLKDLLVFGSCDGTEVPEGFPYPLQTTQHEGRLYWVVPQNLVGKSMVESVHQQIRDMRLNGYNI